MSRIGKKPITIPAGVTVEVNKGGAYNHLEVKVSGPKGELTQSMRAPTQIKVEDGVITFTRPNDEKQNRSFHGLYRALVNSMIEGVTNGFEKNLEIHGIGYRAEAAGDGAILSLGYSHKIEYNPPAGITVIVVDATNVKISGIDKQLVGQEAARIRAYRKPEPYKGKGVRYKGEIVNRKSVKQA